ncbi:hypothetical protein QH494_22970 [Sphingomonas sp. AR_OL41]|jgi:hypothetical protein|uniref:hypothetical protein n=1 Tax=Sphingomonas sp. AR_OL41 TaxID=3042729 RepID=UPI0024807D5D|nr:hypothetical protein [Sphingomonas sp. AR_OL41]MDH7975056.1 hypothetical protein [Sphingomonas sp. AR_OL41]
MTSPAFAAPEKPVTVLARAGGSIAQRDADRAQCAKIVADAPGADMPDVTRTPMPAGYGGGGMPAAMGASIAFLIIALIEDGKAHRKGEAFCLENMGYAPVPLTAAEKAEYLKLAPAGQRAWEERFLASDLAARIAAVLTPTVPPLPAYRDAPATIGGLRFLPESFTATMGPVAKGGVLLTGRIERWRTATLDHDVTTSDGLVKIAAKAGAVFHQVDYRSQRHPLLRDVGSTWCGPVMQTSAGGAPAPSVYCFSTFRSFYAVFRPAGFDWLAGPYDGGFALEPITAPIALTERAGDDLGPLALDIVLSELTPSRATLEGYARRGERRVLIWSRRLKRDKQGGVTLPLWSRRALIAPASLTELTVALDDKGDGTGLRDAY